MDKYKKLALNTIIFAVGSFGQKILSFLLIRLYTEYLAPAEMSKAENIVQIANFLIPIITFSIADAALRFGLDKQYNSKQVFTTGVVVILAGDLILTLLSPIFNLIHYLDGYGFILYIFVYSSGFRTLFSQFTRSQGKVKLYAFDGILATLSILVFNIIFMVVLKLGILGYLLSMICSDICSAVFLFVTMKLSNYMSVKRLDIKLSKQMFKYAVPLIPTAVLWSATSLLSRLFVTSMVNAETNGLYSVAYKVPNLISVASLIFIQAWNMSAITEHENKGVERFYSKVFNTYESVMYMAAAWLILLLKPITHILVQERYYDCYKFMPLLVLAVLMMTFSQFLSSVYCATQNTKNAFWTSVLAAGINVVFCLIFIPVWGAQGASFASFASYAACYAARLIDSRKYIKFRVNHVKSFVNMATLFGMSLAVIFEKEYTVFILAAAVLFITAMNFSALLSTIKKILNRRRHQEV